MHSGLFILAALHCAVFCMAHEESCTADEVGGCASSGHSITNGKEATQSTFLRGGHRPATPLYWYPDQSARCALVAPLVCVCVAIRMRNSPFPCDLL